MALLVWAMGAVVDDPYVGQEWTRGRTSYRVETPQSVGLEYHDRVERALREGR